MRGGSCAALCCAVQALQHGRLRLRQEIENNTLNTIMA
jgi:hypothetical protein